MTLATASENKEIYRELHDTIIEKRFQSASPIRRHAHRKQYECFVELVPAGATVLDAGCGEGVLSVMLAKKGCNVTGIDISEPNIVASKAYAARENVSGSITFLTGDIEHLPFDDRAFDYVVSSHVLEHVPDFSKGAREVARVARTQVILAIPTCLGLASMVLLGGDKYWTISRKTLWGFPVGFLRVLYALITGKEGVNEGYEGHGELIHISRFPWRAKKTLEASHLNVTRYFGSTYVFPYVSFLLPVARLLERMSGWPLIKQFGYGTTYVCVPVQTS